LTATPVQIAGITASPGFARGPLHVLEEPGAARVRSFGGAERESAALHVALAEATRELGALMTRSDDGAARTLLEFQIAMLEDDALVQAAFDDIAASVPADMAWRAALGAHIAEYRAAEDPYFAARAADLEDMRDRVLRCLRGSGRVAIPPGAIVVGADLAPSRFLEIDWTDGGIALFAGSPQSHVATLARARGVPMIVGLGPAPTLPPGDVLLDADGGMLVAAPDNASLRAFDARREAAAIARNGDAHFLALAATTANGERVEVLINVADASDLRRIAPETCDGIGLVRTELVVREPAELYDEELQFERYRAIVAWARGRPVTFRTLDAGGDKPIEGYTLSNEPNPFLGMRGVRLSLRHPNVLSVQLRALARVAAGGNVKIMVPMVTVASEFDSVRTMLAAAVADLRAAGTACVLPPLGMMVEVPVAALTIDSFGSDFFSIGSNDLIAYTTASSRDSADLEALRDPLGSGVMRLIRHVIDAARSARCSVSVCGDMAGDPRYLPALLAAGLRSISIAPAMLGAVKRTIHAYGASAGD